MDTVLYRKETARGISVSLDSVSAESIDQVVEAVEKAPRVFFTGAGRSFLMIQAMAMAMMQIGVTAYVTGGVTTPAIEEGDLLIGASCSGETKSVALFNGAGQKTGSKSYTYHCKTRFYHGKNCRYCNPDGSETGKGKRSGDMDHRQSF